MKRRARFVVPVRFDGANLASVLIDRSTLIVSVRLYRRRRTYEPLATVAEMVAWRIIEAEAAEKRAARRKGGRR